MRSLVGRSGSKNCSMTESELDMVILDMLEVDKNWNRCDIICRGKYTYDAMLTHVLNSSNG